jgi:REP element-mobilizing transposase RayT
VTACGFAVHFEKILRNSKRMENLIKSLIRKQNMVIAYHLMWTAYGYWFPNDPRGSMSKSIACDVIAELGEVHYGRKKVQPAASVIKDFRKQSQEALKFSLHSFSQQEFSILVEGLSLAISEQKYTCYACAIMPDHVHILIRKHKHKAEEMLENLQQNSRSQLHAHWQRSLDHPIWGGHGWTVYLDTPTDIRRTIRYIEENPVKWRFPRQTWPFVTEYDGWPLHVGHDPDSPYAKRLRGYV